MDLHLAGFSSRVYADAKLLKQEADEQIIGIARAVRHLHEVLDDPAAGRGDPTREEKREQMRSRHEELANDSAFYLWVSKECNAIIREQLDSLRDVYEKQKDSGE